MRRALPALLAVALTAAACTAGTPQQPAPTTAAPATTTTAGDETTTTEDSGTTTTSEPSETTTTEAAGGDFPVTIAVGNGDVTIEARPERIVSLSPTATEILFDIGAGSQVVAADSFSDFPADAPTDPDLVALQPNVEAIVDDHDPDLVIMTFDPGEIVASFEALGVPVIVHLAAVTLDDTYTQYEQLGAATGNPGTANDAAARIREDLAAITADVGDAGAGLTYYHELDPTFFSATSDTFIGQVYGLFGLENIADPADADGSAFGFPQLSGEFILDADPDLVFLADTRCCDQTAETVVDRPGWSDLAAVPDGVVELDDDVASRWGPRIVDFAEAIADAIAALEPAA